MRSMPRILRSGALAAVLTLAHGAGAPAPVWAQLTNEALRCAPDDPQLDPHRYLRAVSLDVRGVVPTVAEHDALDEAGGVSEELIDQWLASDQFVTRGLRFHRDLLWNSLSNIQLVGNRNGIAPFNSSGQQIWWRAAHSPTYRGGPQRTRCLDEPARFGPDGGLLFDVNEEGYRQEGWVMIRPYWDPSREVRVCGFDAQDALVSSEGTDCGRAGALADTECGCGPDLRWCAPNFVNARIVRSLALSLEQRIGELLRDDRPYTELFTGRRTYVDGPLVHFWRHLRHFPRGLQFEPAPMDVDLLPDVAYPEAEQWSPIDLHADHAGVLTDPAYLLRFQTNRARANRYYSVFLCQPFAAPPGGLPSPADNCSSEPDLQQRCGCKYCHALLEPTASHWGRWSEQGAAFLDPDRFPRTRADCQACALRGQQCNDECRRFYVTDSIDPKQEPYLGGLQAYEFRRPEHERNVESGPRLLALTTVTDNRLPVCSAGNAVRMLFGREPAEHEAAWVQELATRFVQEGYSWRGLIKAVVTSDVYRRVR